MAMKLFVVATNDRSAANDVEFSPEHVDHKRIAWPDHLESAAIKLPSWILRFIAQNMALSVFEANQVKSHHRVIQAEQTENQLRIRRLQHELSQALSDEKQLSKQSFACDVALSPFRRLPDDILYQIIQHLPLYLPPSPDNPSRTHVPTILSQVSKQWRNFIYGVPHLWQNVRVFDRNGPEVLQESLQLCGRLSRSLPLTVEINEVLRSLPDAKSQTKLLSTILFNWEDRQRLRTLNVRSNRRQSLLKDLVEIIATNEGTSPPKIKTGIFEFSGYYTEEKISRKDIASLLNCFPTLQYLWLDNFAPTDLARQLPHNMNPLHSWSHLTRLFINTAFSAQEMYLPTLLALCPRLEATCISLTMGRNADLLPTEIVTHRHLKKLGLEIDYYDSNFAAVLSCCRFPRVTSLHLQFSYGAGFPIDDIPWAASVFPSLRSLAVVGVWQMDRAGTSHSFLSLLLPFSTVRDLTVYYSDPFDLEDLQCIGQPLSLPDDDETEEESADGDSVPFPLPQLCTIKICYFVQSEYRVWEPRREDDYTGWILGIQGTRPEASLSVEHIISPPVQGRYPEGHEDMQRYFSTLRRLFKENDVGIRVRAPETTWSSPLQPLREHFTQCFSHPLDEAISVGR